MSPRSIQMRPTLLAAAAACLAFAGLGGAGALAQTYPDVPPGGAGQINPSPPASAQPAPAAPAEPSTPSSPTPDRMNPDGTGPDAVAPDQTSPESPGPQTQAPPAPGQPQMAQACAASSAEIFFETASDDPNAE